MIKKKITFLIFFLLVATMFFFSFASAELNACIDSDGGENLFEKGTVSGQFPNGAEITPFSDFCGFGNNKVISEGTCVDTNGDGGLDWANSQWFDCPNNFECVDGACVLEDDVPSCQSIEGTCRDICQQGEVHVGSLDCVTFFNPNNFCCKVPDVPPAGCPAGTEEPICNSFGQVSRCDPTTGQTIILTCASGKICEDGQCKDEEEANLCESCFSWAKGKISKNPENQCNEATVFEVGLETKWYNPLTWIKVPIKQGTFCPFFFLGIGTMSLIALTFILVIIFILTKIKGKGRKRK